MKQVTLLTAIFLLISNLLAGQVKTYETKRLEGEIPRIDGRFDEAIWDEGNWKSDFIQFEPVEGDAPSQKTSFKLFYDDENIYVAIKNYDTEPDRIEKRMTRRDGWEGDVCGVHLDSYFDKRTAFVFLVNAAGVKNDGIMTADGDDYDDSLDPVWFVKTKIVQDGWQAEMKIPLSQLRFGKSKELTWGFQVVRQIFRHDEFILWQPISREKSGWISQYAELKGLKDVEAKKQIELAPFFVAKMESYEEEEGNPFQDGLDFGFDAGVDAKIALTNDIIMDLAINPDFGQVEADPSELNLTAFETYFQEKRPFFIEGTSITNYQVTSGGNPWSSDNLLYSRRIGRQPQFYPDLLDEEFMDIPNQSRILGAVKVTGKTKNGWSLGIIESLVNRESATIDLNGNRREIEVEPLSNYLVGRLQKDINKGHTIVGGMITATNRFISEEQLLILPDAAYTGGLDVLQFFKEKKYFLSAKLVGSYISGDKEAISDIQLSSRRYFQRPDADYLEYDKDKTSIAGHGGTLMFGKSAISGFRFLFNTTWRSPGLELNDVGYLRRADNVFQFIWAGYEFRNPFKGVRQMQINGNQWAGWDFGATTLFKGLNINTNMQFSNFWRFYSNYSHEFTEIDNGGLRGGAALYLPGGGNFNIGVGTNSTKKFRLEASYNIGWSKEGHRKSQYFRGEISYRPISTLSFEIIPEYHISNTNLQYIDELWVDDEALYLFGGLDQKVFNLVLRVDYNITSDFTIQFYGSPYITAGLYDGFKEITDPAAEKYLDRYFSYNPDRLQHFYDQELDENYFGIDKDGDGQNNFFFDNPNFNFKQFRSNLVARWEYTPGSVVFLVWSQGRTDFEVDGSFDYSRDIKKLFEVSPRDVFLIKLSHRFRTNY